MLISVYPPKYLLLVVRLPSREKRRAERKESIERGRQNKASVWPAACEREGGKPWGHLSLSCAKSHFTYGVAISRVTKTRFDSTTFFNNNNNTTNTNISVRRQPNWARISVENSMWGIIHTMQGWSTEIGRIIPSVFVSCLLLKK